MKIGIDAYCFHRYFGEVYDNQQDPGRRITCDDFLARAVELGVAGVSLETCFFESTDDDYLKRMKETMDRGSLECLIAWGHPAGLEGGENLEALADMERYYPMCHTLGTDVLRMVGSHYGLRNTPHRPQMERLMTILKDPVRRAEDQGIKLAMENHFDFRCDEMLEMFETIDSPNFGMTFDTGNAFRYGDDPVEAAGKLGKYIHAIHFKDVAPLEGGNPDDWFYNACTPIGQGMLDVPTLIRTLDEAGYDGIYAIEFDYLDPKYVDEDTALAASVEYLKSLQA
ncbi:MAG: sugar phosphate isomerase/epimerase family protein [Thermoguttaceae bacterium]